MKRSLYLILLAAVCALALAAVTSLSGCAADAPANDPTGNIDTPEPQPTVTGETAVYTSGYVDIALTIPEGWQWESVQDKSMGTEGIRFWKTDDKAAAFRLFCWRNGYGLCGTDLVSKELTLSNGKPSGSIPTRRSPSGSISIFPAYPATMCWNRTAI